MGGYLIKRILWIIPTLFVIASIFFVLSKNANKDPIESILDLQGINQFTSPDYYLLYEEEYKNQGLTLPDYYFSLVPNNFPKTLNTITHPNDKLWIKNLLKAGYSINDIDSYKRLLKEIEEQSNSVIYNIRSLDPEQLSQSNYFDRLNKAQKDQILSLINQKVSIPIPTFYWHGFNNQFHRWLSDFFSGNWGISYVDGSLVSTKVITALKWTLTLAVLTFIFIIVIGIPFALWVSYKKGSVGKIIEVTSLLIYVIPLFWLATLIQVFLTTPEYGLQVFPTYRNDFQSQHLLIDRIGAFFSRYLPALFCIFITYLAVFIRLFKSNISKESTLPYTKTALSKGQNNWKVYTDHILPNVMIPIVTLLIGMIPSFLGGSLVIEVIFNIPGMGRLLYNSIQLADWSVVYYMVVLFGIIISVSYLLGDIINSWLSPKISFTKTNQDG